MQNKANPYQAVALVATMRSGSNLLERLLSQHPQLIAAGELFNPSFIGTNNVLIYGDITIERRNQFPQELITAAIAKNSPKLPIIRYFHDHTRAGLDPIMENKSIAKIILQRNTLDSFISLKIASLTEIWINGRRTDAPKNIRFEFIPEEYEQWRQDTLAFYDEIRQRLRETGQSWIDVDYQDIKNLDQLNGISEFLNLDTHFDYFFEAISRQNPKPREEYLTNPEILEQIDYEPSNEPLPETHPWQSPIPYGFLASSLGLIYVPLIGTGVDAELAALEQANGAPSERLSIADIRTRLDANPEIEAYTRVIHPRHRIYTLMIENIMGQRQDFTLPFSELATLALDTSVTGVPDAMNEAAFEKVGLPPRFIRRMMRFFVIQIRRELWSGRRDLLVNNEYWPQCMLIENLKRQFPLRALIGEGYPDETRYVKLAAFEPICDSTLKHPIDMQDYIGARMDVQVYDLYREDFEAFGFISEKKRETD